jgi:hypothetical protein
MGEALRLDLATAKNADDLRELIAEHAWMAGVSTEIITRYAQTGDDLGLSYQAQRIVLQVRAMLAALNDLRALNRAKELG